MTKGIILIDMPESCVECDFCEGSSFCEYPHINRLVTSYIRSRPDWCPIKPMPEKIIYKNRQGLLQEQLALGWNACIDDILGGENG